MFVGVRWWSIKYHVTDILNANLLLNLKRVPEQKGNKHFRGLEWDVRFLSKGVISDKHLGGIVQSK